MAEGLGNSEIAARLGPTAWVWVPVPRGDLHPLAIVVPGGNYGAQPQADVQENHPNGD